ncbi:Uncharacterized protein OS=Thiocystis violascens (strain ATCC 17096 / DSM 198 / 6111) GN=Thivi_1549 PE=4 SV=1 [Gemmata massiliana]|uniref:Uncharacterized protein n=1 Tax=Gemmata massiliana TaxID=1210884 RepID=A0A6P2D3U9_9BACT|nr:hypothetical protein [Gemmata massiliana]VTR95166.1 Uncharacterized protein OS=Thiocystis violascens (strain ATCC 17096 / DSM 198 / 6111) GN=Thivi_1549 PE=4 SV=1 [Gemmata massiliana]
MVAPETGFVSDDRLPPPGSVITRVYKGTTASRGGASAGTCPRARSTAREVLDRFARELSALLAEGRGRNCTVEHMIRKGTEYVFAHPDDFAQNVTAHTRDGELVPRTFRHTFPIIFAFHPGEGALELYAKLSTRIKLRAEVLFARTVLGAELGEWRPDPTYEPNVLKDQPLPLDTDPEDHVSVSVRRLRLVLANRDREITLTGDPEVSNDACHILVEVLDRERVPASSINIILATFCFEFHAVGRRRAGAVTFDVAFPNSCELRNQRPDRVAIITKYLTRWGSMSTDPLAPIWHRLNSEPPVFLGERADREIVGIRDRLTALGLLSEISPSNSAVRVRGRVRQPGAPGGARVRGAGPPARHRMSGRTGPRRPGAPAPVGRQRPEPPDDRVRRDVGRARARCTSCGVCTATTGRPSSER